MLRFLLTMIVVVGCSRPGGPGNGDTDSGADITPLDSGMEVGPVDAGPLISACGGGYGCLEYHPPIATKCDGTVMDACPRPAQAICDFNWYWIYYYWQSFEGTLPDGAVFTLPDGAPVIFTNGMMPPSGTCDPADAGADAITSGGPFP
jgi:hypothetical protein